ncbi:LexA family transcriptional regulator [Rhizobium ruizarguesonis]|uniref:hypothetical protein n=1 Tax=Rhizobium ruizarguesonis TaxID=2081791 RepID=UPI001E5887E6|nr:hypothetical protein [Rhizobium ruizarguesonis]UFW96347.1 hypothetical protein RlegTA1_09965 [Rhizobium ruizarguesonis]
MARSKGKRAGNAVSVRVVLKIFQQRHFQVTPPSVHQMVLALERAGLIRRQTGVARSIEILVAPENLPILQ